MLYHKTYEISPSHEWVVLVHGAGGSSSIWYRQIKEYKKHFNVLLLDLRGHGKSKNYTNTINSSYTFEDVAMDVIKVIDHLKIPPAHFVGISLGTIVIRAIGEIAPEKIKSMILGGAVTTLNIKTNFLLTVGNLFKRFIPYMWLYNLFAWVIMPKKRHKGSRMLFVKEAQKLCQKEFIRWFELTTNINPLLKYFQEKELPIPTLYLMGREDYMFLTTLQVSTAKHKHSQLIIFDNCGHVCNVDQFQLFNKNSISFINENSVVKSSL